jgi:putative FmdB family regulatory protein
MPRYDFRCRECEQTFEVTRPMSASSDPAPCPGGHSDTVKLLTTVAVGRSGGSRGLVPMAAAGAGQSNAGGGGCCGGGCGCG